MPHFMQRRLPKAVLTPVPLRQTWFAASKFAINIDSSSISVPTFRGVEVTTPKVIGKPFAKLSILNLHWVRGISYIFSHGFNRFSPVFFVGFLPFSTSPGDAAALCLSLRCRLRQPLPQAWPRWELVWLEMAWNGAIILIPSQPIMWNLYIKLI